MALTMADRSKGGRSTVAKKGREYMRLIGAKGGKKTVEIHGKRHMQWIGSKGGFITQDRHYFSDEWDIANLGYIRGIYGENTAKNEGNNVD